MLKKKALRKILITSLTIVILLMIYIMPGKESINSLRVKPTVEYKTTDKSYVYMLNDNNFLVKVNIVIDRSDDILSKSKEIINSLVESDTTPNGLKNVIPKNVIVTDIQFDSGLLSINFSKDVLNIKKDLQSKFIEAVSYSLFEIKDIKKISMYVNDENLSNYFECAPDVITREYGINKKYNLKSLKNIQSVIVYYYCEIDKNMYMVPVTSYINDEEEKIKIIIENLSSNYIYEPNLVSLLNSKTKLINYEIDDDLVLLNFNNSIFSHDDTILEEVVYTISNSVFDNYDVNKLIINVNNKTIKEINR